MILPYSGCLTRRSTRTTIVLSPLSDTTVPVRTRLGISIDSLRLGCVARASSLERFDAGDRAAHDADPARLFELVGGRLEAQVELLALQLAKLAGQLVIGRDLDVFFLGHD